MSIAKFIKREGQSIKLVKVVAEVEIDESQTADLRDRLVLQIANKEEDLLNLKEQLLETETILTAIEKERKQYEADESGALDGSVKQP